MKHPWLTGIAGLLLAVFLTFYALQLEQKLALCEAHLSLNKAVDQVETELTAAFAGLEPMFLGFQQYLELMEQMEAPSEATLRRIMDTLVLDSPYMISLLVSDNQGDILYWTNSGPRPNLADRGYFNVHTSSIIDGIDLSEPLASIMSPGQWILGASKAIRYPDESLDKVLIAIIDTRRLFSTLEKAGRGAPLTLTVLSQRGDVYARNPDHDAIVGSHQPELLDGLRSDQEQTDKVATAGDGGRKHLLLLRRIDAYPLVIRAELPLDAITAHQPSRTLLLVTSGAVMALLLLWQLTSLLELQRQKKNLQQQLRREKVRDPLTGLLLLPADTTQEIEDNDSFQSAAIIMVGPDRFADFQQEFGEQAGDDLIVHCARTLEKLVPRHTRLYRAWGSSFYLLQGQTEREQALTIAERIRSGLSAEPFCHTDNETALSSSVGVTIWNGRKAEMSRSVQRAATALASARQNGGDQVYWLAGRESWLES